MLLALEAAGIFRASGAIHVACKQPAGGSSEHNLKGTDSKGPSCGLHLQQAQRLRTVSTLAVQGCWVHVYFYTQSSTVCRGHGGLLEDLCSRHPSNVEHCLRDVGDIGSVLGKDRDESCSLCSTFVRFSLLFAANCWVTVQILHM